MHANEYLPVLHIFKICKKRQTTNKLLLGISLLIIAVLLPAYFATSALNGPLSSGHRATTVPCLNPEVSLSGGDFHTYGGESLSAGKFLVANKKIKNPRFARTIVLLINYSRRGAAGLIINRPTGAKLNHVLPDAEELSKVTGTLYFGGPVAVKQITMVIQSSSKPEKSVKVFDDIYVSSSLALLEEMTENRKAGQRFRLYAGYAGWGPGQLEAEIARNDWRILKGNSDIVFSEMPDKIWQKLVPHHITI
jgi:putative transcriptional regulator